MKKEYADHLSCVSAKNTKFIHWYKCDYNREQATKQGIWIIILKISYNKMEALFSSGPHIFSHAKMLSFTLNTEISRSRTTFSFFHSKDPKSSRKDMTLMDSCPPPSKMLVIYQEMRKTWLPTWASLVCPHLLIAAISISICLNIFMLPPGLYFCSAVIKRNLLSLHLRWKNNMLFKRIISICGRWKNENMRDHRDIWG